MLILPNGRKEFDDKCWNTEPKGWKLPNPREDGYKVTKEPKAQAVAEKLRYRVPLSFCSACGDTNVNVSVDFDKEAPRGSAGVTLLIDPAPEIDLKPGDAIYHGKCGDCTAADLWKQEGTKRLHLIRGWNAYEFESRLRMQDRLIAYIKAKRLSGITGVQLGER